MIKIILLVLIAEILTVVGQIMLKKSANSLDTYNLGKIGSHVRLFKDALSRSGLWLGLFMMGLGLVAWLLALAQGDLSLVFSLGSMQYLLILVLAHYFLGEKIDRMKVIGTFLVIAGIILIAMS
ncbi:MAG: EamA family transporter [Candidatus Omnitrophica bacterium]|nr:EamA family transporter [Candidatus Omnitrophota bacterium]